MMSSWADAFPKEIPFYHLGQVRLAAQIHEPRPLFTGAVDLDECQTVAFEVFTLDGPKNILMLLFDASLDQSIYTELGNIIASQLSRKLGEDGIITPPHTLSPAQVRSVLAQVKDDLLRCEYLHVLPNGSTTTVQTLIVSLPEDVAHA